MGAILEFIIAFIVVFAIGMGIRYLINKSRKPRDSSQPAMPPPPTASGLCPQCGKPIQPGASFCNSCGAKIK